MSEKHHLRCGVTLLLSLALVACQAGSATTAPDVGAKGIGDPYYDTLGNGGYDVLSYDLSLDVDPVGNTIQGSVQIEATASSRLTKFYLDLDGPIVESILVNGQTAEFAQEPHELAVTPAGPIEQNAAMSISVAYHASPAPVKNIASPGLFTPVGWFHSQTGAINVWSEPNGAASWFPVNDHPLDKATYRFEITVPKPWIVAANGHLAESEEQGPKTRYVWEMNRPMASYLATLDIDMYTVVEQEGPGGVSLRSYLPPNPPKEAQAAISKLPEMMSFLSSIFGQYPFDEYGMLVTEPDIAPCRWPVGGAEETQTLSLFCPKLTNLDEATVIHELAHQWFGNDVSLSSWKDVWLKEGMATYAEWMWANRDQGLDGLTEFVKDQMASYSPATKPGEPPADDLVQWENYMGGALTLHALRLKVGDKVFFEILRTYLDRFQYGNAGTQDFIAVAEEVSGQELSDFFDSWLLETSLPSLPAPSS
jgi:aminopeptidase N